MVNHFACKTHEITKIAIGIWSAKTTRALSPGAETVCGLSVQTAGLPGRTPVANCRRATYTARHPTHSYTRGARHYGTQLEGTLTRSNTLN
ncbi:hypothetical protein EVAR_98921_1 [Eumeta japonica]|uniref:Uncharacterized protein n=1 Tax=Eumeta variegata TaxID=151549 RepID=A0A4C1Y6A5_EUMVA|nr:hypothetical protein EVAR_98921_1 [Eumeta japonica]